MSFLLTAQPSPDPRVGGARGLKHDPKEGHSSPSAGWRGRALSVSSE